MFVNLYRSHSILRDTRTIDYKNKNRRQEALENIGNQVEITGFGVTTVSYTHLDVYKRQVQLHIDSKYA